MYGAVRISLAATLRRACMLQQAAALEVSLPRCPSCAFAWRTFSSVQQESQLTDPSKQATDVSTKPTEIPAAARRRVFASTDNPTEHTADDVGRIFRIRNFQEAFPEGMAGKPDFKFESDLHVLIRREAWQLLEEMKAAVKRLKEDNQQAPGTGRLQMPSYVLNGPRGIGKSYVLNHLVHFADQSNDWIVLFIPSLRKWLDATTMFYPSATEPGTYDQPPLASAFLKAFLKRNEPRLRKVPLRLTGQHAVPLPANPSLADLCRAGAESEETAAEVAKHVIAELKATTEYPVLVVMDEYNALYAMSAYFDTTLHAIPPHNFSFLRPFFTLPDPRLVNGAMIVSVSYTWPWRVTDAIRERLLSDEAPTTKRIGTLNRLEVQTLLARYKQINLFIGDNDRATLNWMWAMSGGVPAELLKSVFSHEPNWTEEEWNAKAKTLIPASFWNGKVSLSESSSGTSSSSPSRGDKTDRSPPQPQQQQKKPGKAKRY